MKIGFLGNTNNYPFTVARALGRMGHDVLFLVDRTEPLHRPEGRYADIPVPYPGWIVDLSPLDLHENIRPRPAARARAVELLRGCDAVVLNMLGPSLLPEIGRPAVVMSTGSDLEDYANYRFLTTYLRGRYGRLRRVFSRWCRQFADDALFMSRTIAAQREGFRRAATVNYFARGLVPKGDALLDGIGVRDGRRTFFMMAELESIRHFPAPANPVARIFSVARLTWKAPDGPPGDSGPRSGLDFKGTDILVRGLALFRRRRGIPVEVRLVKKGRHVAQTMELVAAEGISDQVTWLEEMTQSEVLEEYARADIVCDQLGSTSMMGMGGVDAMAAGRPVIANYRPGIMDAVFGGPAPICQAATPEEVCAQLSRLVPDPAERERVGRASRAFAEAHLSPEHAARLCLERVGTP